MKEGGVEDEDVVVVVTEDDPPTVELFPNLGPDRGSSIERADDRENVLERRGRCRPPSGPVG